MAPNRSVKPVDPVSLRGLASHAESHWLTFATAMRCYAHQPTRPALEATAGRHGPSWLRSALRKETPAPRPEARPREFDPRTGSLAFLTAGAEEAMKPPAESSSSDRLERLPERADVGRLPKLSPDLRVSNYRAPANENDAWNEAPLDAGNRDRMERFLTMAAARADITRRT